MSVTHVQEYKQLHMHVQYNGHRHCSLSDIHVTTATLSPQQGSRLARRNAELSFVFITDGVTSSENLEEGVSAMRRAEGVPTVIAMGSDADTEVLRKVALGDAAAIFRGEDYTLLNKPSFFERFVRWIC